jgi:thiamine-monophosphate kinase
MAPFGGPPRESVAALGEVELIARIRRWLGKANPAAPFGIGDDCAVLPAASAAGTRPYGTGGARLVTVDPVIYGRHFDDRVPARLVGEKLLKRNLSDIAAMGGQPEAAVVALILDPRTRVRWLEGFYRGLAACARRHGVAMVGGDVAQGEGVLAASLTLLGFAGAPLPRQRRRGCGGAVPRRGAAAGDHLYVTGVLGNSLASGHHYRFRPRLPEGAWLARRPEVKAMMDLSDGLAKDVHALMPRGGAPALFAACMPLRQGADLRAALEEGEDYELLLAVSAGADRGRLEADWKRAFPRVRLTRVGEVARKGRVPAAAIALAGFQGYEHLKRRVVTTAPSRGE